MIKYEIKTGNLWLDDKLIGRGYSGHSLFLNDEQMTHMKSAGPIPKGLWHLADWEDHHKKLGNIVVHLVADLLTQTFGRSEFFIHGDNIKMDHTASDGCIILSESLRKMLKNSGQTLLTVF